MSTEKPPKPPAEVLPFSQPEPEAGLPATSPELTAMLPALENFLSAYPNLASSDREIAIVDESKQHRRYQRAKNI